MILSFAIAYLACRFLKGRIIPQNADHFRLGANLTSLLAWSTLLYLTWPITGHTLAAVPLLYNISNHWSPVPRVLFAIVLLDLIQYGFHRCLHASAILWLLHRFHHSDETVDETTGVRHHMLEPIAGALVQGAFIVLLGLPAISVLTYSIAANLQAVWVHADIKLTSRLSRLISFFLISPDVHRLHHVADPQFERSNFGALFPWWDRAFGTFVMESATPLVCYGLAAERRRPVSALGL